MGAIRAVFPGAKHILCRWHVAKNVLTCCRPYFPEGVGWDEFHTAWGALLQSPTEEAYSAALGKLRVRYAGDPRFLAYLDRTWLPYKESLVQAWTDRA
jgi:histone-lysine N-methyltransferase SETD2